MYQNYPLALKRQYSIRFEWIFYQCAEFSLQTSENNLTPQNQFKRQIRVQQWMTTRQSYIHNFRGILKMSFFPFNFLKTLMVSDKTIHKAFRIHEIPETNPFRENSNSHYVPNYALALNGSA